MATTSSLWLLPPPTHPLHAKLSTLISTHLPTLFGSTPPPFAPHVTLASGIPGTAYSPTFHADDVDAVRAQEWLDAVAWPAAADVRVRLGPVGSEDAFFRRCYLRVDKRGVGALAALARVRGVLGPEGEGGVRAADEWVEREYAPHCSLMYADAPVDADKLKQVEKLVADAGIRLDGDGELGGWTGGVIWLVPTYRPLDQWKPIAVKNLE